MFRKEDGGNWINEIWSTADVLSLMGRPVDVALSVLGHFVSQGGFRYWQSPVSTYSLHLASSGRGWMEADGRVTELRAGQVYAFFPGQYLHYWDDPEDPWTYHWIKLDGHAVEACLEAVGMTPETPLVGSPDLSQLKPLYAQIQQTYESESMRACAPTAFAWQLLSLLEQVGVPGSPASLSQRAVQLLESYRFLLPTVQELSEQLRVSRTTLFREFKQQWGCSPKAYLDQLRMQRVEALLLHSAMTISEVAAATGFTDEAHFCRTFRRKHGEPPSHWRRKASTLA